MMRQTANNDSFAVRFDVFESTQVALNIEFLELMPPAIDQSSFFVELAEEMQLTFCEQIDNGCPVLLGLWTNVLKAEKKLEELLHLWEEERSRPTVQYSKSLSTNSTPCLIANEGKAAQVDILTSDTHARLESTCVGDSTLILPSHSSSVTSSGYESSVLPGSPQLYIVSSDVSQLQSPQLLRCTIASVKTAIHKSIEEQRKENILIKSRQDERGIKEIYVDIAVNPLKNPSMKNKSINHCLELKSSSEQHPLDKLCQLLCIDEDETVEKRLCESERKRKLEEKLPYKYFCDQCSFKAKRENHLLKHAKLHEKIKDLFCCDQCDFRTIRESVLCRHKMQHSSTQLHCKICPYKTDSKSYLLKHVQNKHGPNIRKKVKCNYCDYSASTPRELHRHLKILHKPDIGPKFWKCSKCPYKSKLRAHLTRHDNDIHSSLRQFLCHYCGKSFKRNDTLTQHKTIHGEVNKTFTCIHCGKICTSSVFLREHMATHTTERPFLCDVCGSSFKTRGATQRHKRAVHSTTPSVLVCSQCERSFKSRADLNRHRKTHRLKTEATVVPAAISGANVQEDVISTPITIQVVYTEQLNANNQDVTIK